MLILVSVISICLALEHFCLHGSKTKAVRVLPQCEWVLTMTKVHMMHQHPPFFHPKCNRENRRGLEIFNQVSLYFKWINCNKSAICRPICILFWHTKTKWPHTASKKRSRKYYSTFTSPQLENNDILQARSGTKDSKYSWAVLNDCFVSECFPIMRSYWLAL